MAEMSDATAQPRANLQYVCDMLDQLRRVAAPTGGPVLLYLLDMAKLEAAEQLKRETRDKPGSAET